MKKSNNIFIIFLTISLVIHILLIRGLIEDKIFEKNETSYNVSDIVDGVKKINFFVKEKVKKIISKAKLKETKLDEVVSPEVEEYNPIDEKTEGGQSNELAKYLEVVRNQILKNKNYPLIAKRLKQEGSTTVYFEINKNGELSNIKIEKSSGFELLDNASISAVELSKGPASSSINLIFPISSIISIDYRLKE